MSKENIYSSETIEKLLDIGIALSSIRDLNALLDMILKEARKLTSSDAGTIYLVEGKNLRFMLSQVQTLFDRWGEPETREKFSSFEMPISKKSMAGYAAITGELLNVPDVHDIPPEKEYSYNSSFDEQNDYRTVSMINVPMKNREGKVIAVLQLINPQGKNGAIIRYPVSQERIISSFASQAGVAIQNVKLNSQLRDAHQDTVIRLGIAAEYRDKETANHIKRVSRYCSIIASELGWDNERIEKLYYASAMHDVGKLGVPDSILQKPGKLTDDEYEIMTKHTVIGAKILNGSDSDILSYSKKIALTHHEKWNGRGYPQKLSGEEIPVEGRIVAIADVYDALSSRRCYKPPFPEEKCLAIINEERGEHFDPFITGILLDNMPLIRKIKEDFKDTDEDFDKMSAVDAINPAELMADDSSGAGYIL